VTLCVSAWGAGDLPRIETISADALEQHRLVPALDGERARKIVGCGRLLPETDVRIVDPDTREACPPDRVGEIWIRGPQLASGYWNKTDETRERFGARTTAGEGPFFRTGDLGFLAASELFVTGRIKDLLIVRGLKHYPHDIERTAEKAHASLRPGCSAAFATEDGVGQRLVLAAEVEKGHTPNADELRNAVKRAVSEGHDVKLHEVVLLPASTIPKTSSGKIQRSACRRAYLDGTLEPWEPR
jgi:acyl-CoA synthetase (AMP-forming)/AMP-acid ligase II